MKIELDHDKTQQLSEIIHGLEDNDWDNTVYHLTDAVYCPVKPYCRLTGLVAKASRKTAAYWTIGRAAHKLLEENFELKEKEVRFQNPTLAHPCYGHIDVLFDKQPINFKTTRKHVRFASDIPELWITQNSYECVFTDSLIGWLPVLEIIPAVVTVWELTLTPSDLALASASYVNSMGPIQTAVDTRNPYLLEPSRRECKDCVYSYGCPRRPGL